MQQRDLNLAQAKALVNGRMEDEGGDVNSRGSPNLQVTVNQLTSDVSELRKKLEQKDEEILLYKNKHSDCSKQVADLVGPRLKY